MSEAMLAQLKGITLFQAVGDEDLRTLAGQAKTRSLPSGKLVFKEGEPADSLYIVLSGSVKIFLTDAAGKETVLDTKKAGEYFGEMMLDHRPRSASVMTFQPSEFAVISREDFKSFLRWHPDAAEKLILNLIRVTRAMNERARQGSVTERLRGYMTWLGKAGAADPTVKRWFTAKRWVLAGILVLAIAQYYFFDVLLRIMSVGGITTFR